MNHSRTFHRLTRVCMPLRTAIVLCLAVMHQGQALTCAAARIPSDELRVLETALDSASVFKNRLEYKLDSLKMLAAKTHGDKERWRILKSIADGYRLLDADSSLRYSVESLNLSRAAGMDREMDLSRISVVDACSSSGLFSMAGRYLDSISPGSLDLSTKLAYWRAGRTYYAYISQYVSDNHILYRNFFRRSMEFDDSLMRYLPASDGFARFLRGERLVAEGKYLKAKECLDSLMADSGLDDNIYGMAAYQMAKIYRNQGNEDMYAVYLAKSATSDVRGCVSEGLSLPALADWLCHNGGVDKAFHYINYALRESNRGNLRMRMATTAMLAPVIDEAYRNKISSSRTVLIWLVVTVSVLFLICAGLSAFLIREVRRVRAAQERLKTSAKIKNGYIATFVGLCSSYAERLDNLASLAVRKIESGQTKELVRIINSGRLPGQDDESFYKTFDKALLDIFPDFIESVNALLRPEERITPKEGELLTPELRIYAFVKLGVTESVAIAKMLRYSPSTVYNYRNRMRNKARNRDNFDSDVMNAGFDTL